MKRRELLVLGAAGAAALAAGGIVGALAIQSASGAGKLLSASFSDLSGQPRRLSDWRGRGGLFNFWGARGAPRPEGMPILDAAGRENSFSPGRIRFPFSAQKNEFSAKYRVRHPK